MAQTVRSRATVLRSLAIAVLAAAGSLGVASLAQADTSTGTGTITAGVLSETASPTFAFTATLSGADQTATYTLPITVTDARGTGAGWNLTITSTTWTAGTDSLHTTASNVTSVVSACVTGVTCTNPTNTVGYPVAVPAGTLPPTAVKFFNAGASSGMGQFTVTPTVAVTIPGSAKQGTYASTVTLAAVSGP